MQGQLLDSKPAPTDEIDLVVFGRLFWRRKKEVAVTMLVTAMVALTVSFVLPKSFTADVSILPMTSNDSTAALAAGLAGQLGPLAGMLGSTGSGKTADLVEILGSRAMRQRIIEKCHLDRELKWKYRSDLLEELAKMTTIVRPSIKDKSIVLKVRAKKPELAALVANTYVSELKLMLDEIGYNSASKNRVFVEKQLAKTKESLVKAENSLADFQEKNRLVSLPETVVASMKAVSDLESQRISAKVQLQSTDEALGTLRSQVDSLQANPTAINELELKKKSLARQESALNAAKETFLNSLKSLPPKAITLARLQRDLQVQNALYLSLTQQFETALIDESKESDAFLPLDTAIVPDRPSFPKKGLNTVLGGFLGFILGLLMVLVRYRSEWRAELS